MTLTEFRAWLDGYTAALSGLPTAEQWQTIKDKLATVEAVSAPVYVPQTLPSLPSLPSPIGPWWSTPGRFVAPTYDDGGTGGRLQRLGPNTCDNGGYYPATTEGLIVNTVARC